MHELPKELSNSLRSWRGSVYGNNGPRPDPLDDLEKGPEDYGEKAETTVSPAQSSLVLHPTASNRSLRQVLRLGRSQPQPNLGKLHTQHEQPTDQQNAQATMTTTTMSSPKAIMKKQATFPPQTPASQKLSLFHNTPHIDDPDPASNRLDDDMTPLTKEHFYELIGMARPASDRHPIELPKDLALPHGLYTKIRSSMRYVQIKYRIFDAAQYLFLALQLLLSAVFIVLGSVQMNYHLPVAILGAVSAVVAGALSLMKGQGLPNRLRHIRDNLQNVLFEAEELYWDVAADRNVLFKDIVKVREDFLRVMEDARKNHPDSWTGSAPLMKGLRTPVSKARAPNAAAAPVTTTTTTIGAR